MPPVSCVISGHVAPSWWYPQGMTVLMVGPKSIMGTWWLNPGVTKALTILSVLTGMQSRFQEVSPATMVHYCTWFRHIVDFSQNVHLITMAGSLHAQCAQNKFAFIYSHRNKTAYFTWTTHLASHSLHEQGLQPHTCFFTGATRKQNNNWTRNVVINAKYKILVLFRSIIMWYVFRYCNASHSNKRV